MKPFETLLEESVDVPIEELTAIMYETIAAQATPSAQELWNLAVQYAEDCARYSATLALDVAEAIGGLSDTRQQVDDKLEAAFDYLKAAALYQIIETREDV